jgi:type IX secretion system PorP/SprF family membrane protein
MAGSSLGPRVVLNYRNEWSALNKAFLTYSVSYDEHVNKINSGFGLQIVSDNAANKIYNTTIISGIYNYQLLINKETAFRLGFSASYIQRRIDFSKLLFLDQFNSSTALPDFPTLENVVDYTKKSNLDVGLGFLVYGKKAYMGLGVKHVSQPNESFYKDNKSLLPTRISLNIGAEIKTKRNGNTYISPNAMFALQGKFRQIQSHVLIIKGPVILGMGIRNSFKNNDATIFYVGIKKGVLKTVYSYDNTISSLRGRSGGTHEISISVNYSDSKKASNKRNLKNSIACPLLF